MRQVKSNNKSLKTDKSLRKKSELGGVENHRAPPAWLLLCSSKTETFPESRQRWCHEVKQLIFVIFIKKRGFLTNHT